MKWGKISVISNIAGALSIPVVMGWYLAAIEGIVPLVPKGLPWLPIILAAIALASLVISAISQHQLAKGHDESKSLTTLGKTMTADAPRSISEHQNGINLEVFRKLLPVLERRYIHHEHPAAGRPLPDSWLQDEIGRHLEIDLWRQLFDEAEIDAMKLPLSRDTQKIENVQELFEYQRVLRGAWTQTEQAVNKMMAMLGTLSSTWSSFRPAAGYTVPLPGTQNIALTPDLLAVVQKQTADEMHRLRLYVVMFESLLRRVVLADPRSARGE